MLRASSEQSGKELDFKAITGGTAAGDTGIEYGDLMIDFADAVLGNDNERLIEARQSIHRTLGPDAVVDSAAVAGLFNAIDRIADATGAPLEPDKAEMSATLRAEIGIDKFAIIKEELEINN